MWNGFKDVGNAGLSFNFDLDLWGKNRAALRAAKKDADAARYDAQEARLLLTTGIASTYADLTALYAQRDSLQSALDIRMQTLKLVKQRVDVGLDNDSALRLAEARIPQTQADLAATDEAIMLNKHALAALMGQGPDRALTIARPAADALKAQGLPASASIDLIGRRPDIAAARMRLEAAANRIKEARAAFYPNISISAVAGFAVPRTGQLAWRRFLLCKRDPRRIVCPFFTAARCRASTAVAAVKYDEAVALYDGQVIQALRETADAVTSQKSLVDRLAQSRSALAVLRTSARTRPHSLQAGPVDLSRRAHRRGERRQRAPRRRAARDACLHPRRAAGPRPWRRVHGCLNHPSRRIDNGRERSRRT